MRNTPNRNQTEEISVCIRLSPDDGELLHFLRSHGVKANPDYGVFNSGIDQETLKKILEHPAPFILAWATVEVMRGAFRAYVETHKRRIFVRKTKTGVTVDATNYPPDQLKKLSVVDLIEFEPQQSLENAAPLQIPQSGKYDK